MSISDVRVKRTVAGDMMLQVSGDEKKAKADGLAFRMKKVIAKANLSVRVGQPAKFGVIRVVRFDNSVAQTKLAAALANVGRCRKYDVRIGPIQMSPSEACAYWAQCSVAAVRRLARAGHVRAGWTRASVEVLPLRQIRCHRCLHTEHVQRLCASAVDRSGRC